MTGAPEEEKTVDLTVRGRIVLGVVGIVAGLAVFGAGAQFTDWWWHGGPNPGTHDNVLTTNWPVWLAAPAWVLAIVTMVVSLVGGLALAVYTVALLIDGELRAVFLSGWARTFGAKR